MYHDALKTMYKINKIYFPHINKKEKKNFQINSI